MKSSLSRLGGPAGMLGGILWLAYFILQVTAPAATNSEPYMVTNPTAYIIYNLMFMLSVSLIALALLGLYARQADSAGVLGKVGASLAALGGLLFIAGGVGSGVFEVDGTWYLMMAGAFLLCIAMVVLGATTLRTQVLGLWSFVPLAAGLLGVTAFAGAFAGIYEGEPMGTWIGVALRVLTGLGWVLLGYALMSRQQAESTRTGLAVA